ncbi:Os02g0831900 [Oryza sativa Japonica Group]|uniref:Os02g0831900 protein n=2 Tax=Oryza sativa subsp. japonica TaxID=39947 RepID=Q0DW49_ORYSJ|nr:hypothetical protein EE612_014223 [Oryza sativa]BAF10539.1 Os02g0831900 [Oryza sativa Japonica Group]BAS81764.1 Os02g0831900 [Oryza sativa Japonica Group]|eukprot:NP_001048625.1 Os02g0831900 [Oryza sativa Japonica Group]
MRSLISASLRLEPYLRSPSLSSSKVMAPLASVSMALNISLRPASSSSERFRAMTRSAIFLSLFMAENCLRRERTAGARGRSGATPSSQTQGWQSTWWAVRRSLGGERSMRRMRSLALSEMVGHGSESKSRDPRRTASKMPCCVSAQKGGTPLRRM